MKVLKMMILLLFTGVVRQSFAQNNGTHVPVLQQSNLSEIDIQHINLRIQLFPKEKTLKGAVSVYCSPVKPISHLHLDAAALTIDKVMLSNGKKLAYTYNDTAQNKALAISLDREYKPGDNLIVQIEYKTNHVNETDPSAIGGSNGKGVRFLAPSTIEKSRQPQIWSMGEPDGNMYWFPCVTDLNDLRTTTIIATIEDPFVFISNGVCSAKQQNGDGTTTFTWDAKTPYANHKTAFVVGKYINYPQQYKQVNLNNYCYPGELEAVIATTERLPDMMRFFSDLTGADYPYPAYSQTFVQEIPWGISNMMMSIQTENMIDDYPTHKDYLYLWDALEGESLAAQWFGNYVGIKSWSDVWLEKGLSRYISWMYSEYKNGHDEFLLYQYVTDFFSYKGTWDAGIRMPVVTNDYEETALLTDPKYAESAYPYFKADLVLHMLRKHLGDAKFLQVLQHYVKTYGGKTAGTADFKKVVELVSGEKMDWFFDQWIYQTGHPVFEVSKKYNSTTKKLELTVKQVQQADTTIHYPQVEYFQGKIAIAVDDQIHTVWLKPQAVNEFALPAHTEPRLVNFDFENTWIKEISFEKSADELLYQLNHDKDIMGRYFAIGSLVGIAADSTTTTDQRNVIWNGISQLLKADVYWRIKFAALFQVQGLFNRSAGGNPVFSYTPDVIKTLKQTVEQNTAWVRSTAISILGRSKDSALASFYIPYLNDSSERVVNAAAIALGRSGHSIAFDHLIKLKNKPSWKSQSLISALYALTELKDERAAALALASCTDSEIPHWTLGTPVWDHRLAAVNTLVALGQEATAYPLFKKQFDAAIKDDILNDIFYVALQVAMLGAPGGQEIFDTLKQKYAKNETALAAAEGLEAQFQNNIKK